MVYLGQDTDTSIFGAYSPTTLPSHYSDFMRQPYSIPSHNVIKEGKTELNTRPLGMIVITKHHDRDNFCLQLAFNVSTFVQLTRRYNGRSDGRTVVISFQSSTFVSLMQRTLARLVRHCVMISFQFSTFVSLMQRIVEGITTLARQLLYTRLVPLMISGCPSTPPERIVVRRFAPTQDSCEKCGRVK